MSQSGLRAQDFHLLDRVFQMESGYVLDFTNATFAEFFQDEFGLNIDNPRYAQQGTSKAKRLRYFLRICQPIMAARVIAVLWQYRESLRRRSGQPESLPDAGQEIAALIRRLGGQAPEPAKPEKDPEAARAAGPDAAKVSALCKELIKLHELEPQQRGYAFERFLNNLFSEYRLAPRSPFRNTGEQIDGSFELGHETYLLEAKWTNSCVGVSALHGFNGKIQSKAAWSRGLFVSYSGFSEDGLDAFAKGEIRIICMDGLDLSDMLQHNIPFTDVIAAKVRKAAETGRPFIRVRELNFPCL